MQFSWVDAIESARATFALLTPEKFRERPWTRHYGYLMREYATGDGAIARNLPHRSPDELTGLRK